MKTFVHENGTGGWLIHILGEAQEADVVTPGLPDIPQEEGVIINASDPLMLVTALDEYRRRCQSWVAIYRPHTHGATVVWAGNGEKKFLQFVPVKLECCGTSGDGQRCRESLRSGAKWPLCRKHQGQNPAYYQKGNSNRQRKANAS